MNYSKMHIFCFFVYTLSFCKMLYRDDDVADDVVDTLFILDNIYRYIEYSNAAIWQVTRSFIKKTTRTIQLKYIVFLYLFDSHYIILLLIPQDFIVINGRQRYP